MNSALTVSASGVTRWLGDEQVLAGVDLRVPPGSVCALLGRNGCGKSTLIRILAGSLARHGGAVEVLGQDPERLTPAERARIVWVTDRTAAPPSRLVQEELQLRARLRPERFDRAQAHELLQRWEVPLDKRFSELSRGLQARFRLASALAARPELLLLDEPALGLDLFARRDLLEVIVEVVSELEAAVVIASHQVEDVERIADQLVFLAGGRVVAEGDPASLRDRSRQARVRCSDVVALEEAAAALLGVRRVAHEAGDPRDERVVHFEDYSEALQAQLLAASGAELLEVLRPKLSEVYFEVLGNQPAEVRA